MHEIDDLTIYLFFRTSWLLKTTMVIFQSFGGGAGVFAPMSPRISSPARTDNPTGVGRGRGGRNQRDNEIIGEFDSLNSSIG